MQNGLTQNVSTNFACKGLRAIKNSTGLGGRLLATLQVERLTRLVEELEYEAGEAAGAAAAAEEVRRSQRQCQSVFCAVETLLVARRGWRRSGPAGVHRRERTFASGAVSSFQPADVCSTGELSQGRLILQGGTCADPGGREEGGEEKEEEKGKAEEKETGGQSSKIEERAFQERRDRRSTRICHRHLRQV